MWIEIGKKWVRRSEVIGLFDLDMTDSAATRKFYENVAQNSETDEGKIPDKFVLTSDDNIYLVKGFLR